MKVLITGASGMVGRNIVEQSHNYDVELITPSSSQLNLLDKNDVDRFLGESNIDTIVHCAGVVGGIQANIANPVKFFYENMQIGLNIVKGAKDAGVKNLINLGSSCMYPRHAHNPLIEELILSGELEPTNEGYAIAKIGTARLCDYIAKESNSFNFKTIIPCNLYGRFDNFDPNNAHMIPAVIAKIHQATIDKSSSVEIWGDGNARREFMYVGDLANIILSCIGKIDSLPQLMNVGLGHDYTINEYYQCIADIVGYKGNFNHNLDKPVGMLKKLVDTSKMKSLNLHARTSLRDGISKTYEFYMENL